MAGKTPENEHPVKTFGWAARDSSGHFSSFNFSRRATGENDVRFKVLFCGICHTDLHFSRSDFGSVAYPMVPGHEIAGVVTEVGKNVTKLKVGDNVGVGCLVWSCKSCSHCELEGENFCPKQVLTYGIPYPDGTMTYGGYSNEMVVDEHFAIVFPKTMPLDGGCPLLCAGITVYSAMKHFELNKPGAALGVVGLGGLGHVAVKFAKAFGCKVTVISHSASKKEEALNHFGADSFLVSSNPDELQAAAGTLNGIVDSVSAPHDIMSLINLLKPQGKLITVGAVEKPVEVSVFPLIMGRRMLAGSSIGGLKDTQEMIDFAAKHKITADIEVIAMDYVNEAFERLEKGDVRYRFVIDIGNTLKST